jgi:hypothetical protein
MFNYSPKNGKHFKRFVAFGQEKILLSKVMFNYFKQNKELIACLLAT